MPETDALERLGLSPGEAKVYRALLGLESASVGPIAHASGVSRSKIYEVLEKLAAKGLANPVIAGKQRLYRASGPAALLELVKKRRAELEREEKEVQALMPELMALRSPGKRTVEFFEGVNGLMSARDELLASMKKGETLLVLGAPRAANERWEGRFLDFHRRRERRGIGLRIIYNADTRSYGQKRTKFRLSRVRYMPKGMKTPTWFDVYNDKVLIVVLAGGERPYALLVRDGAVADSVKAYFEIIWRISKE